MQQAQQRESTELFSKAEFVAIPPEGVPKLWHMAEPLLAKATALSTKIDTQDFEQQFLLGQMQLWLAAGAKEVYAALATEVVIFPSGWKVCRVMACGGDHLWRWKQRADEEITAYAIAEGCDAVEIVGMDFWENVFPGFEKIETVFSKRLPHD